MDKFLHNYLFTIILLFKILEKNGKWKPLKNCFEVSLKYYEIGIFENYFGL